MRVSDACRAAEATLAPPYRTGLVLLKPDGTPASGNMLLSKVREIPGKPTQTDKDAAEIRRQLVEEVQGTSRAALVNIEEGIEDAHSNVTEAMIRALED